MWKRHIDQLLKDNTQISGTSELDDAEISTETSTSSVTGRNHLKHQMDREALRTLLRVPVVMILQPRDDNCNPDPPEPTASDAEAFGRRYPLRMNRGKPRQQTE